MEQILQNLIDGLPWHITAWVAWVALFGLIASSLAVLAKGADWLVKEAVVLSERSGLSKVVIGATVVSLGTTTPEAAVSVLAAFRGSPDLALGNAVGSIICDTGLILGIACLIAPLPLHRSIVNRQGWVQLAAGFLLVIVSWPLASPGSAFSDGGRLSQTTGFLLLMLLVWYIWQSVRWARTERDTAALEDLEVDLKVSTPVILGKLVVAIILVVGASHVLIPCVREAAERLNVPEGIIAATLVAFGTSLPELVTAVTAARHGHGDLAIGNIVGADILNVLFVAGAAAAVTPQGLDVSPHFFRVLFPAMLFVLIVFRIGILFSGDHLKRGFGVLLLVTYVVVTVFSYLM
jgi:cation:H+ antiporter